MPEAQHNSATLEKDLHPSAMPPPSSYTASATLPSGHRLSLTTSYAFPDLARTRYPPFLDSDGVSPIFIGSVIMGNSVHPCKVGPALNPPCYVTYYGKEIAHQGQYNLLPFDHATMEWVPTSHGRLPPGRKLVEGGYEENGQKLYHATASIYGCMVPGKTGEHLGAAHIPYGWKENIVKENYDILCWKY